MLVVRSQRWYFYGKTSHRSRVKETVPKSTYDIVDVPSKLTDLFFELLHGFLLRIGFESSVEKSLHPVMAIRKSVFENIAPEEGGTPVPGAARETGPKSPLPRNLAGF